MAKETVVIESLGKWGPKIGGTYYSFSKKISDGDKGKLVPGGTFEVDIWTAESGKKYINSVLGSTIIAPPIVAPVLANVPLAKAYTPAAKKLVAAVKDDSMTRADWDSKDRRISRQGLWQAAIQAVAPLVALEQIAAEAEKLADAGLEYVNRK